MDVSTQLTLRFRPGLRLTDKAFMRLCQANPELRLERTAFGELEIMTPATSGTGGRNANLTASLVQWAKADGTGLCFDSSAGFTLPNGAIRSPDASWIARDNWEALSPEERAGFAQISPDFVAELRSPTDKRYRLRTKMQEYIDQGTRLGWLIDPMNETVEVYRSGKPVETLKRPMTLSGKDVLRGFTLDLSGILYD